MTRRPALLLAALVVIVAAGVAIAHALGSSDRVLHARFTNAGGLVKGGAVRIAGRNVGHVSDVELTDDGLADVTLSLDGDVRLHRGTRAAIRALGQAGITNHYVALSPGSPAAPGLGDGATLPPTQTTPIVNIDAVLDSFGPARRARLQRLIENSSRVYAGAGARSLSSALGRLPRALQALERIGEDVGGDQVDLRRLVRSTSIAAGAIDARRTDLDGAVTETARLLGTVAAQRRSLDDLLVRAPGVLTHARRTLTRAREATDALRPALREIPPLAPALGGTLRSLHTATARTRPVAERLDTLLPDLRRALRGLSPLRAPATAALLSAGRALDRARPILRAARLYGSDLLLGVFNGFVGIATANYNRNGHYIRLEFVQPPEAALDGQLASLFSSHPLVPGLFDLRTGLTRRCPGGNTPPAPDGSNPWVADPALCTPGHDVPADVNSPPGR